MLKFLSTVAVAGLALGMASTAHAGDAAAGEAYFNKKCKTCHTTAAGDKNKIGPNLHGVVGRACGSVADFKYAAGYQDACGKGFTLTADFLETYLISPSDALSGVAGAAVKSKMVTKVKDAGDRANLVSYLSTLK